MGTITFAQDTPSSPTTVLVGLQGLGAWPYLWHVHQYPSSPSSCSPDVVGTPYDPLQLSLEANYPSLCATNRSMCALGDLSGRYGYLNSSSSTFSASDADLSLYGAYTIFGRSVVLNWNSTLFACANIGYPAGIVLYAPFRAGFAGNVYFLSNYGNSTAVFADLNAVNGLVNSSGHNWHVHIQPALSNNCAAAGDHYNPLGVQTGGNYSLSCGPKAPELCEVGDLSGKGGVLDVTNGMARLLYVDLLLPLLPQDGNPLYIVGRSVVVHGPNGSLARLACANISLLFPLDALAQFNTSGVVGIVRFRQATPFDVTVVTVSLTGLGGVASGYHVNALQVQGGDCSTAGNVWDPTGVGGASTPLHTSDQFKVGDLSGKFGNLAGLAAVNYTFSDSNLPLFGQESIVGRSLVLSFSNDSAWLCSNVQHSSAVLQSTVNLNTNGFNGSVIFSQPTNDPFAATTIVVEFAVYPDLALPSVVSPSIVLPPTVASPSIVLPPTVASPSIALSPTVASPSIVLPPTVASPSIVLSPTVVSSPPVTSVPSLVSAASEVIPVPSGVTSGITSAAGMTSGVTFAAGVTSGVTSAAGVTSEVTSAAGVTPTVSADTSKLLLSGQETSYLLTTYYGQLTLLDSLVPSPTPTGIAVGKREVPIARESFLRAKRQQPNSFLWSLQSGGCGSASFNPFNSR